MLLSMTGHGQATSQDENYRVLAEIRSVNNRYLKINVNCDLDAEHHSKIESLVKSLVKRGSVSVRLKTTVEDDQQPYKLNEKVINSYWTQLSEIAEGATKVEAILQLPGVVEDALDGAVMSKLWPICEKAVIQALIALSEMRKQEGKVMQADMLSNCDAIGQRLETIKTLAPEVIKSYSKRMTERINQLLAEFDVSIQPTDIVREVGIFADKCDISEETVRLGSHVDQFRNVVENEDNSGKKLEFLVQEMLRETNTIGSKANHVEIAKEVVEVKTAIERIREMVQNVE